MEKERAEEGEGLARPFAPAFRTVEAVRVTKGVFERLSETVAVESRVDMDVDGTHWASFALSPSDLVDFAYGISLSTGLVSSSGQIAGVEVREEPGSLAISLRRNMADGPVEACPDLSLPFGSVLPPRVDEDCPATCENGRAAGCQGGCRNGGSACGPVVSPEAIWRVSESLLPNQGMHLATGATHAALFADPEGRIVLMREDVGRHNAVDKLLGAIVRQGVDPASGFVYLSSRCALELVAKCARVGIRMVATVSAPTSAVLDFAKREGVTLCAFAREGRFTVYTHGERIRGMGELASAPADRPSIEKAEGEVVQKSGI